MKVCSVCKEEKAFNEFSLRTASKDGYHYVCKECDNKRLSEDAWKLKQEVFTHYGPCVFPGCGEDDIFLLTLDHTNNNGAAHRRELKKLKIVSGASYYRWIIKNNFPSDLQTHCVSHNYLKGYFPKEYERRLNSSSDNTTPALLPQQRTFPTRTPDKGHTSLHI